MEYNKFEAMLNQFDIQVTWRGGQTKEILAEMMEESETILYAVTVGQFFDKNQNALMGAFWGLESQGGVAVFTENRILYADSRSMVGSDIHGTTRIINYSDIIRIAGFKEIGLITDSNVIVDTNEHKAFFTFKPMFGQPKQKQQKMLDILHDKTNLSIEKGTVAERAMYKKRGNR